MKIDSLKQVYKPYLIGLIEKGKSTIYYFNAIKEKQKTGKDKPNYQDYYSLYDASLNFFEYLTQSPFPGPVFIKSKVPDLKDYFSSTRCFGNIYIDVYEKQYTSAIVQLTGILQNLLSAKIDQQLNAIRDSLKIAPKPEKPKLEQRKVRLEKILNASPLLLKYGSFAATIARAETSDDVEKAIEAAALPSGSSRIKRETPFNVSLNAYTGLFGGYEHIVGMKNDKITFNNYGVTAPIGVAISTGAHHWSYSIFISLIDIGAVASFRFQNDTVAQIPTILLKDIVSPGVFFSFGFPKCPLSFNLGAQVGPNLRNVNVKDEKGNIINKYQENVYLRYSFSIVVDIPIFNFYSKSKN